MWSRMVHVVIVAVTLAGCAAPATEATSPEAPAREAAVADDGADDAEVRESEDTVADDATLAADPSATHPLAFSARSLTGGTIDVADAADGPAALWMWAPWCPTCRGEAPTVAAALDAHPEVALIGAAALAGDAAMHDFVDEFALESMLTVVDDDGSLWGRFGVRVQPAWAFVTADGDVTVHFGPLTAEELDARLTALASA